MKLILNQISNLRKIRGFSHEYMAYELGISQAAYSKIENYKTQLTVQRLFKIAEILNVSAIELLKEKIENDQKSNSFFKELPDIIIKTKDEIIIKQQEEIEFLRKMLSEKK